MWGYFALTIAIITLTTKEKKVLLGIVSTISLLSGVYLVSFVAFFLGNFIKFPLISFLSDPASCIRVEGGLGPDIRCEWGEPTLYAIFWAFAFFGIVYLFSVIKRKKSELGNFPKILLLLSILLSFALLILTLNVIYQSSPQYEQGSFRNRVDSFIPENREAKRVGQQIRNLRLVERLESSGSGPYKELIIETDFYLPKDGHYRFSAWNQDKEAWGLTQQSFINGNETDSFKVNFLSEGVNKVKFIFRRDEK